MKQSNQVVIDSSEKNPLYSHYIDRWNILLVTYIELTYMCFITPLWNASEKRCASRELFLEKTPKSPPAECTDFICKLVELAASNSAAHVRFLAQAPPPPCQPVRSWRHELPSGDDWKIKVSFGWRGACNSRPEGSVASPSEGAPRSRRTHEQVLPKSRLHVWPRKQAVKTAAAGPIPL